MENPGSTAEYINDPEVGPVILQVLQIVRGGNAAPPDGANDAGLNAVAAGAFVLLSRWCDIVNVYAAKVM